MVNWTRPAKRLSGDGGAAMIEGAIVALPFFILIFGALEFGLVFKNHLSIGSVATSSARAASTLGSFSESDFQIIDKINERALGVNRTDIHTIVVWHATGPGDPVPSQCRDGSGWDGPDPDDPPTNIQSTRNYGACNVYDYTDFNVWTVDQFDCIEGNENPEPQDFHWCASDRKDFVLDDPTTGWDDKGTDYIGVYVAADYDYITGLFGDSITLSASSIIPIEAAGLAG